MSQQSRFQWNRLGRVVWTNHALQRMLERKISLPCVLQTLVEGQRSQEPVDREDDAHAGDFEFRFACALRDDYQRVKLIIAQRFPAENCNATTQVTKIITCIDQKPGRPMRDCEGMPRAQIIAELLACDVFGSG